MAFQRHSQLGVIAVVQRQCLAPAQQRTVAVNGALPRRQNDQPPPMGLVCGQVCPAPELVKCVGLGLLGVLRVAGQNGPADRPHGAAVLPQEYVQLAFRHPRRPLSSRLYDKIGRGVSKICETLKSML